MTIPKSPTARIPRSRVAAALLLIVVLGTALRLHKLGAESIWLDEAYSINVSHLPLRQIVQETAKDVHPPLYYFLLHYWMPIAGDSETGARLLSVLLAIAAMLATYWIAATFFTPEVGVVAAGLLAISRFNIEFSQEARMYILLALLGALSMFFLLRLLAGSRRAFIGYIVTTILMMYTQVYGLFIVVAQNVAVALLFFVARPIFRRTIRDWLLAQVLLLLMFLPWMSVLLRQVTRVQEGFWIQHLGPSALIGALGFYAGSVALAFLMIPLMAWGIACSFRDRTDEHAALKATLLLCWLGGPLLLPFLISQVSSPIFLPKYTLPASLPFAILVARGLVGLRGQVVRLAVAAALIVFSVSAIRQFYGTVRKEAWREAVAEFQQLSRPGDLVLFSHRYGQIPFDYYLKRRDVTERPFPDYGTELAPENVADLLRLAIEGHDRVWLVLMHQDAVTPLIPKKLGEWYELSAHRTPAGVELYLFEKKRADQAVRQSGN